MILLFSLYLPLSLFSCKNDEDDDSPTYYTITISSSIENGSVEASKKSASSGESIKLTAKPATGYELDSYSVTDSKGSEISVTNGEFKMPASSVTVSATFKETQASKNQKAADAVIAKINAIGTVAYTSDSKALIDAARAAYNALTEAQKALVPTDTLTVLTTAETTYSQLEVEAATVPVTAITLNKTETSIKVGATETLSVTSVLPEEATDKTYTWKTSDETKATVDQDGKVTAVAEGTVTIYAEANDGSGVKGNCTVTVTSAVPEYYNKLTQIADDWMEQVNRLKRFGRGYETYNSSLTAAQAYALATYQAAIDGRPVYVIMSSQDDGYEIHYALSTDAAATEHTADLYDLCSGSNTVRMYYVAQ